MALKFLPFLLLFLVLLNTDLIAQKRIITDWSNGSDEVLIIQNKDFKPEWLARKPPKLLYPAAIQATDKLFYVLFKDGSWVLRKNIESQLEIKLYTRDGDFIGDAGVGNTIDTEEREVLVHVNSRHAMENLRFVISRDDLAVRQMYKSSPIYSLHPRTKRKSAASLNVEENGPPTVIDIELAMCRNKFSLYLPGGDLLYTFFINRKLPASFFQRQDTVFYKGIFRLNSKHQVGKQVKVYKRVIPGAIYYSFENPNPFDVDVTVSFGSEYTIKLTQALGGQELIHPPSLDTSFGGSRVTSFRLKGGKKVSGIKASLENCEFARNKFYLNISSITPVDDESDNAE